MTLLMSKRLIDDNLEAHCSFSLNNMIPGMKQSFKNLILNVFGSGDTELKVMPNRVGTRASFNSRSLKRNSAFVYYSQFKDVE